MPLQERCRFHDFTPQFTIICSVPGRPQTQVLLFQVIFYCTQPRLSRTSPVLPEHILRKILDCTGAGAHGERSIMGMRSPQRGPGAEPLVGGQAPLKLKSFCLFNIPRIGKIYVAFCILLCLVFHSRFMQAMMPTPV